MGTTTIRLDDELKARLAAAAERAGTSAHAFVVGAIERSVEQAEADDELDRVANRRWARLLVTGESLPFDAVSGYVRARARGEAARQPVPAKRKR
jgi:predicted transcriptional regulator